MKVALTIPTWKNNVDELIKELKESVKDSKHDVIIYGSCVNQSASKNRNQCIRFAKENNTDICIQVDDDTKPIQQNWLDKLIEPLIQYQDKISIISPQLVNYEGNQMGQLGNDGWVPLFKGNNNIKILIHKNTGLNVTCSSAWAFFTNIGVKFDENSYIGAAYEDSDFCMSVNKKYPNKKICVNFNSKIIHLMHGSWHKVKCHRNNKDNFAKKWGINL